MTSAIRSNRLRPNASAFTLVELMIVMLVVGIIAGLAMPMLHQTAPSRLRAAADMLSADLSFAQIESISHGDDPRVIVFDLDANAYRIATTSDPDTPIINPTNGRPYLVELGTGATAQLAGVFLADCSLDGDNRLQFGIYGQLDQTEPAVITLGANVYRISLTMDPISGEVTIDPIQKLEN